jgi:hypothetical protein
MLGFKLHFFQNSGTNPLREKLIGLDYCKPNMLSPFDLDLQECSFSLVYILMSRFRVWVWGLIRKTTYIVLYFTMKCEPK